LARFVLKDIDFDDARRLHPVEHHATEVWVAPQDAGKLLRKFADLGDDGAAHPILHRPSHRRTYFEEFDVGVGSRKSFFEISL
jgi:hypothetical protein